MEGIDEMSLEEKQDLEEGMFDRFKANVAGAYQGAKASVGNVAGSAKGRLAAATTAYGKAGNIAGHKQLDAAAVKAFAKADSLLGSFLKNVSGVKNGFEKDIATLSFGQFDDKIKPDLSKIMMSLNSAADLIEEFQEKVQAAKTTGQWKGVVGSQSAPDQTTNAGVAPAASAAPLAQAAESISRSVTNRLFEMNRKQQRRARR